MRYDRTVLVDVLIYHQRMTSSGCACGWAQFGHSHAEHIANVYEDSVTARFSTLSPNDGSEGTP